MVLDYYNLKEQPFGVTPDPRFLYMSASHREALATLLYGIRSGRGFMSLIAPPGMGKTTILFQLLSQLEGSARTVFLFQTSCRPRELLRSLLRDLGLSSDGGDMVRMQEQLNELLIDEARRRRKVVIVIDEAQNLENGALELLRTLSNFETSSDKLMQIVLAGQPQLSEKLASPGLLQLRQRMSIFARLHRLNAEETQAYIQHRLRVAGYGFDAPLFTPAAAALIAKYSEGTPRNINNICFNALSLGYVLKQKSIEEAAVRESLADLNFEIEDTPRASAETAPDELAALRAIVLAPAFRKPFAWRRGLAVVLLLALQIPCFSDGRRGREALLPNSLPAEQSSSWTGDRHPRSATPDRPSAADQVADAQHPVLQAAAATSTEGDSRNRDGVSALTRNSSPPPSRGLVLSDDPSKLWAQVKEQNSDAEVELARLYLEGKAVPQNCAQAQVLLMAASRRGNSRADDLLSDPGGQCR